MEGEDAPGFRFPLHDRSAFAPLDAPMEAS